MSLFRKILIRKYLNDLRASSKNPFWAAYQLKRFKATEAIPILLVLLKNNVGQGSMYPRIAIEALSEIGCPNHGDELLLSMITEADYQRSKEDDRIPKWGEREGESRWKRRIEYLSMTSRGGIDEFDKLMRALFAMRENIDGYLITCLRILSWRLNIIDFVVRLSFDFNSIYRYANPVLLDYPIDNAFKAICNHVCPMSSNILHLIQEKKDVDVHFYASFALIETKTMDFNRWRTAATEELRTRGYPEYKKNNYQETCACNIKYQTYIPSNASAWCRWD